MAWRYFKKTLKLHAKNIWQNSWQRWHISGPACLSTSVNCRSGLVGYAAIYGAHDVRVLQEWPVPAFSHGLSRSCEERCYCFCYYQEQFVDWSDVKTQIYRYTYYICIYGIQSRYIIHTVAYTKNIHIVFILTSEIVRLDSWPGTRFKHYPIPLRFYSRYLHCFELGCQLFC